MGKKLAFIGASPQNTANINKQINFLGYRPGKITRWRQRFPNKFSIMMKLILC